MITERPATIIIGAFDDIGTARMTLDELRMAGFDDDELRLVESDRNTAGMRRQLVVVSSLDDMSEAVEIIGRNGGRVGSLTEERLAPERSGAPAP